MAIESSHDQTFMTWELILVVLTSLVAALMTITQTCPFIMQRLLKDVKMIIFSFFDNFLIFAQNIDCGYTLELPH